VVLLSSAANLSACGLGAGLYNVALPGGANLGDHPYSVVARFSDALDLVPQAGVRVNDVPVGRVERISLDRTTGKIADVTLEINGDVQLPANAIASVEQTSLLGEKYVSLSAPTDTAPSGRLRDGDTIGLPRTSDGVGIEVVFGALSAVLNGGGIAQLHEIAQELTQFGAGHEQQLRDFLASAERVTSELTAHRDSITSALDGLAKLATTLKTQDSKITNAISALAPGIGLLADQHQQLMRMLAAVQNLSTVTVQTLDASKRQMIEDLQSLAPILQQLAAAGAALPNALQILLTYPFPDAALAGVRGDYINGYVNEELNTPGGAVYQPAGLLPATSSAAPGAGSSLTKSTAPTGRR
jgi:phospholipid/cholesterol/gamma-HCH transport system substrate-binding protein